jgi:endonuclease-3
VKSGEAGRAKEILRILKLKFSVPRLSSIATDPFKVLVRTIISQSTAETNTRRAYQNLSRRLPITPRGLAEADVKEIEEPLKVAGLHRNKSRVITKVSELILQRFNGSLDFVYSSPLDEARRILMRLPGVGPKTADVVLLFSAKRLTLPVDTHVNRVSKRLRLVPPKADYEGVRESLQALYPPREFFKVHILFIALGRKYCKAIKPLHASCPINELCPSVKILDAT